MQKDDLVYIGHMLDTVRSIGAKVAGRSRADFDADENLRIAVAHLIQTIGESARRVSPAFQRSHPEIPWSNIIAMRHKVVHDYLEINYDIVWLTARADLPPLAAQLEKIAPPDPESGKCPP
jgi:uncharacterized protein with HEPN domain